MTLGPVWAADPVPVRLDQQADLTILYKGDGGLDPFVTEWMQREVAAIFPDIQLEWVSMGSPRSSEVFRTVVIVTLRTDGTSPKTEALFGTPLGATQVTDGHVLPFIDLFTARVHQFIRREIVADPDYMQSEYYGKALGRVLAHELYHALSQTMTHSRHGLMKTTLTCYELVSDEVRLSPEQEHEIVAQVLPRPHQPQLAVASEPAAPASPRKQTQTAESPAFSSAFTK